MSRVSRCFWQFRSLVSSMSCASERNKDPILNVLKQLLSTTERLNILEIASGYGLHVTYFAQHFDNITWQPTECDETRVSYLINSVRKIDPANFKILKPLHLDAAKEAESWLPKSEESFDFVLCINLTHISKWETTMGLIKGASFYLKPRGALIIYGPFIVYGDFIHTNNVDFDKHLKAQNPDWGLREVSDICKFAEGKGLTLEKIFDMPANNKTLVFRKQ